MRRADNWVVEAAAIGPVWFEAFGLDAFVGMSTFGALAPAKDAYAHFGITADAVVETAKALLTNRSFWRVR